jgi:FMN phosphatase YigB (HAD superfamily)
MKIKSRKIQKLIKERRLILTDCDGVLLDWEVAYHAWMAAKGYDRVDSNSFYEVERIYGMAKHEAKRLICEFNNSAWMCCLDPFRDAQPEVKALVAAGYRFVCITSLSLDPYARRLRVENLERIFGKGVFLDVVCLDTGADKDQALEPYKNSQAFWIEDKVENAVLGADLGLRSILIRHSHNEYCDDPRIIKANDWAQIREVVNA